MESPSHFVASLVPAISLLAIGATWTLWPVGWKELPATAFGVGLSLLILLLAVGFEIGVGVESGLLRGPGTLAAGLVGCYATTLLCFARRDDVKLWRLTLFGVIGLAPGYYLVGFTLVSSACGIRSAGC